MKSHRSRPALELANALDLVSGLDQDARSGPGVVGHPERCPTSACCYSTTISVTSVMSPNVRVTGSKPIAAP